MIDNTALKNDIAINPLDDNQTSANPMLRQHKAEQSILIKNNDALKSLEHKTFDKTSNTHQPSQIVTQYEYANLPVEAAVAIVINGIHYAVLMASPNQLDHLAFGFLFSEGLITKRAELLDWEIYHINHNYLGTAKSDALQIAEQLNEYDVYMVELTLNQRAHQRIKAQRRQLAGRTGCGMCGVTGLSQALPHLTHYKHKVAKPPLNQLLDLKQQLDTAQTAHQLTGAVHAAATMFEDKLILFEDVGRHNALDKLIGWQLREGADIEYVIITSRLSIELVQKCIRLQLPWLIGMSAPTSTAVNVATRYGLGLAGFLRDNRVTYYTSYSSL